MKRSGIKSKGTTALLFPNLTGLHWEENLLGWCTEEILHLTTINLSPSQFRGRYGRRIRKVILLARPRLSAKQVYAHLICALVARLLFMDKECAQDLAEMKVERRELYQGRDWQIFLQGRNLLAVLCKRGRKEAPSAKFFQEVEKLLAPETWPKLFRIPTGRRRVNLRRVLPAILRDDEDIVRVVLNRGRR